MADKPAPKPADETYSDEEAAKRTEATIRAMIGMKPKPRARPAEPRRSNRLNAKGKSKGQQNS